MTFDAHLMQLIAEQLEDFVIGATVEEGEVDHVWLHAPASSFTSEESGIVCFFVPAPPKTGVDYIIQHFGFQPEVLRP